MAENILLLLPGPKVLHQVPANSIVPSPASARIPLFHFPDVSSYIIPRQEFCSRLLTIVANSYRILGHPICLPSPLYPRNEFLFNFCLVLDSATEYSPHLTVTLKLATLLRTLEEQSHFLSRDTSPANTGKIYALCEILLEDLNNYCESMIPIDDSNTLNIKLFPTYPPPPPLLPYHVPLSTIRLSSLVDQNWDLTLLLILPHIDGVNSVVQIALAADADYALVRKALRHLLYYRCIFLLDIFSFGAIYAPTAELASFVESPELQLECARYVTRPYYDRDENDNMPSALGDDGDEGQLSTGTELVELYAGLKQGQSVRHFCLERAAALDSIDVRRLITFGVIKGFLYRVHKYAIVPSMLKSMHHRRKAKGGANRTADPKRIRNLAAAKGRGARRDIAALENNAAADDEDDDDDDDDVARKDRLLAFLDGTHCFDEICTELRIGERDLLARLKEEWPDVLIFHR